MQEAVHVGSARQRRRDKHLLAHLERRAADQHVFDLQVDRAHGRHGGKGQRRWIGRRPADLHQRAVLVQRNKVAQHPFIGRKIHHARHHHSGIGLEFTQRCPQFRITGVNWHAFVCQIALAHERALNQFVVHQR